MGLKYQRLLDDNGIHDNAVKETNPNVVDNENNNINDAAPKEVSKQEDTSDVIANAEDDGDALSVAAVAPADAPSIAESSTNWKARRNHYEMLQQKKRLKEKRNAMKQNRVGLLKGRKPLAKLQVKLPDWMPGSEGKHIQSHRQKSIKEWELAQTKYELEEFERLTSIYERSMTHGRIPGALASEMAASTVKEEEIAVDAGSTMGSNRIWAPEAASYDSPSPTNRKKFMFSRRSTACSASSYVSSAKSATSSANKSTYSRRSSIGAALLQNKLFTPIKRLSKGIKSRRGSTKSSSGSNLKRSKSFDDAAIGSTRHSDGSAYYMNYRSSASVASEGRERGRPGLYDDTVSRELLRSLNEMLRQTNAQLVQDAQELKGDNDYLACELETLKHEHKTLKEKATFVDETDADATATLQQSNKKEEKASDKESSSLQLALQLLQTFVDLTPSKSTDVTDITPKIDDVELNELKSHTKQFVLQFSSQSGEVTKHHLSN